MVLGEIQTDIVIEGAITETDSASHAKQRAGNSAQKATGRQNNFLLVGVQPTDGRSAEDQDDVQTRVGLHQSGLPDRNGIDSRIWDFGHEVRLRSGHEEALHGSHFQAPRRKGTGISQGPLSLNERVVIRFEYVFLELLTILVFLGLGGFLLYGALATAKPEAELTVQLIAGSVFVALGGMNAYLELRFVFRQLRKHASQE
jgi:hypothetical protein